MWKFTWDRAFPHVEIHQKLWISQRAEILIFGCISTCGNSSGKVYFRMSIYKRIREFPRGKTCGNTRFFEDFHMREYTRKCEFPRAEIHAEMCITACGNTLNQVQKIVRIFKEEEEEYESDMIHEFVVYHSSGLSMCPPCTNLQTN